MCGCATHQPENATTRAGTVPSALIVRVPDMTCGHCASTIAKAVETALPGTLADANPVSKLVFVHGSRDLGAVRAVIARAGYTPTDAALG